MSLESTPRPEWRNLQARVVAMFNQYKNVTATENHVLHGARGKVSVDVFVEHDFGPLSFSIVVECKSWNKRVPQEKAHALKGVVDDVGASMGILLTEKGVQSGCEQYIGNNTNLRAYKFKDLSSQFERAFPYISGVEELERVILDEHTTEEALVDLFRNNQHLLRNLGYEKLLWRPLLRGGEILEPDFILKPVESRLCDILELKLPRVRFVAGRPDRLRVSERIHSSIAQLREYERRFSDPIFRRDFARQHGMLCYRPRLLLLAGSTDDSDEDLMLVRDIERMSEGIRIITYNMLLQAAKYSLINHLD